MQSDFEKQFSDLAYSMLQSTGTKVTDYLIGFEIADKNESGSKAVGFFVILIGEKYYYIPVFFKNGQIDQYIDFYDIKDDIFLPLSDEWIDYIRNQSPQKMGEPITDDKARQENINIRDFMTAPFISKLGSSRVPELDMKLPEFLKNSDPVVKMAMLKACKNSLKLVEALERDYGFDVIKEACAVEEFQKKALMKPVFLVYNRDHAKHLSMALKEKFVKQGYVLVDNRKEDQLVHVKEAVAYGIQESPSETGLYSIITDNGPTRCLVSIGSKDLFDDTKNRDAIVYDIATREYEILPANEILVAHSEESPYKKALDSLNFIEARLMEINKKYILFDTSGKSETGCVTLPFFVRKKTVSGDGNVYFSCDQSEGFAPVNIIVKKSGSMTRIGNDVFVPETYKAFRVDSKNLRIIGRPDRDLKYHEKYAEFKVESLGLFSSGRFIEKFSSKMDAALHLALNMGLSVDNAEKYVKNGKTFALERQVEKKAFFEAPIQVPEYTSYNAGTATSNSDPFWQMGNHERRVEDEVHKAVGLSELGAKSVFDKSVIGSLALLNDVTAEIRSYIPDVMKALDKLGRLLFLFRYKGDKFKDRFTVNEFSETEDLIRDTFRNLGKITLQLKKKYNE